MNHKIKFTLFVLYFLFPACIFGQDTLLKHVELDWQQYKSARTDGWDNIDYHFSNAVSSEHYISLPAYYYQVLTGNNESVDVQILNPVFKPLPDSVKSRIFAFNDISEKLIYNQKTSSSMGKSSTDIFVETFIKKNNHLQQLISFDLQIIRKKSEKRIQTGKGKTYAAHSVLAKGDWYKIKISRDGIYKVTAKDMDDMGFGSANIANIKLYGNGGGMLPEANNKYYPDDLLENAIDIHDFNNDGKLNGNDYFLFYGRGPNPWVFDKTKKKFYHTKNIYDDYAYYFITVDPNGGGLRITNETPPTQPANTFANNFTDYAFHENDSLNLIKSGRRWYGEEFNILNTYGFSFKFPNIDPNEKVFFRSYAIARASVASQLIFTANGHQLTASLQPYFNNYLAPFATESVDTMSFKTSGNFINVNVSYIKPNSSARAWLDYFELNVVRQLIMVGGQMIFRNIPSIGSGNITEFSLQNADNNVQIWDITNPTQPVKIQSTVNNSILKFRVATDSLREFCAHKSDYFTVRKVGKVANQDLHQLHAVDYVILYHPKFKKEAESLADFHRDRDGMNVLTVEPGTIYNEFSSGAVDVSAIRNFMRMLYDKANGNPNLMPRYLLLFGDASYDYKNRIQNNTNLIPTYESINSLAPTGSYATDDFFGLLDENEGAYANGSLDVGIGRFPITTTTEAQAYLNKIARYTAKPGLDTLSSANSCSNGKAGITNLADWRNIVCFIGDDEDYNLHVSQADYLGEYVRNNYPVYNVDKIFFDAYPQAITPGGQRYPDVKAAIRNRVEKGALVINYTGHGGEEGWAHESVLEVNDILAWNNSNNMPVFITATCEFSRYDDPGRISAGEYVLMNPMGGGIALLTTSRVTWASQNFALSKVIYSKIFKKTNGEYPRLGDIIRTSKVGAGSIANNKNFILLGDPALRISYPQKDIVTTGIFDKNNQVIDTLKALSLVTIKGEVHDGGSLMTDFNGFVYPTIYDKAQEYTTLGNDPKSSPYSFKLQKNIIYKGKARVKNGKFEFSFVVPKDISYKVGFGRISYYAQNGEIDANGYLDTFYVGSASQNADIDNEGPQIQLYMNSPDFKFGGITDENPSLLAFVFDEHGINTVGNGIGHDIVAVLDENTTNQIILNDYYQSTLDDYQRGSIRYPFSKLSLGTHTLSLKVWDVYNNSATARTEFLVTDGEEMVLDHLFNAPNPFTDYTSFVFEHNQNCDLMNVEIEIYNTAGQLVRLLKATVTSNGYRVAPGQLKWNGTNQYGGKLAGGIYIYKLKVQNSDGSWSEKTSKLVLMRKP